MTTNKTVELSILGYLPARHETRCAVFDPVPGDCDCEAARTPLVSLSDAWMLISARNFIIQKLTAELDTLKKQLVERECPDNPEEVVKLTTGQKHLLRLIVRDADKEGWASVSKVVFPLIEQLPSRLVELNTGERKARLTRKGQSLISAMAWLS